MGKCVAFGILLVALGFFSHVTFFMFMGAFLLAIGFTFGGWGDAGGNDVD